MQDSDRRPASNRHPILKFMSDFYVTDICTSDLCPFFNSQFKSSSNSQIYALFQILKSASNSQIYGCFSFSEIDIQ